MEAKRYRELCRLVDQLSPHGRRRKQQFADATIVKVYLWSTHCDRAVAWACDADNWPDRVRDDALGAADLPSQPTMSRRLRTVGVLQLLERVQARLADALAAASPGGTVVKAIDSKPLKVGGYSKDRDATRGRAAGEMARGYKLHAVTCGHAFGHWTLTGMNANDQAGAALLLPRLAASDPRGWGYVAADNGYDANPVHAHAWAAGHQLIAPPRASNAHVRDVRRNSPQRIRALDACADPLKACGLGGPGGSVGMAVLASRGGIERNFAHATMDGLFAPPPWVRRPRRVATWTAAKLIQRMARQVKLAGLKI